MKFTSLFNVKQVDDTENRYISFEQFYSFLKSKDSKLKNCTVRRSLQSYKGGIITLNEQEVIPVKSALRYCFHYENSSESCSIVTKIVEREILKGTKTTSFEPSTLDLYRLIAKTKFQNLKAFASLQFETEGISSLIKEHEKNFTKEEWLKICLFERDFDNNNDCLTFDYEEALKLKYSKFQNLLNIKQCCENLKNTVSVDLNTRIRRISHAEERNKIEIRGEQRHLAHIIDSESLNLLQRYCEEKIINVISFDTVHSRKTNTIQIVVVVQDTNLPFKLNDLCNRLYYFVARKHQVQVRCIYIVKDETVNHCFEGINIARFKLRDEIETNKLTGIHHTWTCNADEDISVVSDAQLCESCFKASSVRPLCVKGFDILREWCTEVPLEVQCFLNVFVNKASLDRSKNKETFITNKFEKLHYVYDSLLHIYNRNYTGVFQEKNSNELLLEHKSIRSVFEITGAACATSSRSHAEINLGKKVDEDLLYYNTYLKEHPLLYDTFSGLSKQGVSLRDCHVILMLDNLVRLTYVVDPNPGECRSKQLCTLPLTLQGLPRDAIITSNWHLPDCDGSVQCHCKNRDILGKTDISKTMVHLNEKETSKQEQFFRLMTWTASLLWKRNPEDLIAHVELGQPSYRSNGAPAKDEVMQNDGEEECGVEDEEEELDLESLLAVLDSETFINSMPHSEVCTVDNDCPSFDNSDKNESDFDDNDLFDRFNDSSECTIMSELEQSMDQIKLFDENDSLVNETQTQHLLHTFGFSKFIVPPLLCRHPPPAIGKDDDILKIREILDNVLVKMGYAADKELTSDRILCGPDNKIGKCVLGLMGVDAKYRIFLPEFPLLHLRKSKITLLFSAYQDAGLLQLMKFMRDNDQDDWKKLVSVQHIDTATKYVKRIALSLHLAFLIVFSNSLGKEENELFWSDMEVSEAHEMSVKWSDRFESFLTVTAKANTTFALHVDMMHHCDQIVQIALAERLGGSDGYALLLAAVKKSLQFSFVNNASSYAPYCVKLLYEHYSAGHFHRCLKETLFSTPFKDSNRNFACDTKRELDHIEALKSFRSSSNISSVTCRMSLIDTLNDARDTSDKRKAVASPDNLGWTLNEVDKEHIMPTVALILKQGGLATDENSVPCNVYTKTTIILPCSILDENSYDTGEYLLKRYLVNEKMFQLSTDDIPDISEVTGPAELLSRAKRSKGTTIKRTVKSKMIQARTENQISEETRQKKLSKEFKLIDCFSSKNNTCQAIVKPDSSKPRVFKSVGMLKALNTLVQTCCGDNTAIMLNQTHIQPSIASTISLCAVEFAGFKFKLGNINTGKAYIQHIEVTIKKWLSQMPLLQNLVICEEKYQFTPDSFKAATRSQRKSKNEKTVDHLKTGHNIINDHILNKDAVTKTTQGKAAISTYLAENVEKISFDHKFNLIVDSEHNICSCNCESICKCERFCTPIQCRYGTPEVHVELLHEIKQRKGEGEMAVADYLVSLQDTLQDGQSAAAIISSGDIDAVYIFLYAASKFWKRAADGSFCYPLFVVLQKPGGRMDVYNITRLLLMFEKKYDAKIGKEISLALCIGGNDFIPKLFQISHETVMKSIIFNPKVRQSLLSSKEEGTFLNHDVLVEVYKNLYLPKKYEKTELSFDEVRAITIGKKQDSTAKGGYHSNDPRKRLPPESAIRRLCQLVDLQLRYLKTIGYHEAGSPDFLSSQVLVQNLSKEIEYDFGSESHFSSWDELPASYSSKTSNKRQMDTTPQKGFRRKRLITSTPKSKKTT